MQRGLRPVIGGVHGGVGRVGGNGVFKSGRGGGVMASSEWGGGGGIQLLTAGALGHGGG